MAISFYGNVTVRLVFGPLPHRQVEDVFAHRAARWGFSHGTETFAPLAISTPCMIIPLLCMALAFVLLQGIAHYHAEWAREATARGAS